MVLVCKQKASTHKSAGLQKADECFSRNHLRAIIHSGCHIQVRRGTSPIILGLGAFWKKWNQHSQRDLKRNSRGQQKGEVSLDREFPWPTRAFSEEKSADPIWTLLQVTCVIRHQELLCVPVCLSFCTSGPQDRKSYQTMRTEWGCFPRWHDCGFYFATPDTAPTAVLDAWLVTRSGC